MYKKPTHHKNYSGELDVFEAAGYYAGTNDLTTHKNHHPMTLSTSQKIPNKDEVNQISSSSRGRGSASLDIIVPMRHQVASHDDPNDHPSPAEPIMIPPQKKHKLQPSSPGARIAHFLNSLLQKNVPKNKKKSSSSSSSSPSLSKNKSGTSTVDSDDDEEEEKEIRSAGWTRRRRSSISHFWTSTTRSSRSSSKSSIMITSQRPTDLLAHPSPRKEIISSNEKYNAKPTRQLTSIMTTVELDKQESRDSSCGLSSERTSKDSNDQKVVSSKEFGGGEDGGGDGWDSDSSSDLFELQLGREFRFSCNDISRVDCGIRPGSTIVMKNYGSVRS